MSEAAKHSHSEAGIDIMHLLDEGSHKTDATLGEFGDLIAKAGEVMEDGTVGQVAEAVSTGKHGGKVAKGGGGHGGGGHGHGGTHGAGPSNHGAHHAHPAH